jgi:hypothetical protein
MSKSNTQLNDEFMAMMRAKGVDTIFTSELPHPTCTAKCGLILAKHNNLIYIRDAVVPHEENVA